MMARLLGRNRNRSVLVVLLLIGLGAAADVRAEPYLALLEGYKCNVCHVNPTGGGLRNDFGTLYSKVLLPAHPDDGQLSAWTGKLTDIVRIGADLRAQWSSTSAPNTASQSMFALEQLRVYTDITVIPNKLGLYVDEQVAPGGSQNMEAYVRYGNTTQGLYLKGGQFYLPFGWRLQDQTAFVRQVSGISMTTPDQGVEIGYERTHWSAQLDLTNGAANAQAGSGHQITGQVVYVQPQWRLGLATALTQSEAGNRRVAGVFAGFRTGPLAWLAEADLVRDESFPGGRTLAAGLAEVDWRIKAGHNLKFTAEYDDPNRSVAEDQQTRWSLLYEFTPIPFVQLRLGYRRYFGIPQNDNENRRLTFCELHGYF